MYGRVPTEWRVKRWRMKGTLDSWTSTLLSPLGYSPLNLQHKLPQTPSCPSGPIPRALPLRSQPTLSNPHATHLQRDIILGWFAVEGALKLSCSHGSRRIKRQSDRASACGLEHSSCHDVVMAG